ncbi:major facilitator superfamily transporter [Colletotrichum graminicola M1.001]|uniref:Major facilitator superfamily transporter n=1 Tax=Colletotrichum graminicola (strain M1.001 / M2 / FGSC 10212) TaxID=645133 RepID=E3QNL8_COLGM|nr:major facilitator superfamily transporter [Colletotrichum graminicola M1.001]EFQ32505.1 major facilitator superfamily transporter [Colletotrichum graminicola M1.001]
MSAGQNKPSAAQPWSSSFLLLKPTPAAVPGLTIQQQLVNLGHLGELVLFSLLICLLLALLWVKGGGIMYDWNGWRVILLLIMVALYLVAFIVVEVTK